MIAWKVLHGLLEQENLNLRRVHAPFLERKAFRLNLVGLIHHKFP